MSIVVLVVGGIFGVYFIIYQLYLNKVGTKIMKRLRGRNE